MAKRKAPPTGLQPAGGDHTQGPADPPPVPTDVTKLEKELLYERAEVVRLRSEVKQLTAERDRFAEALSHHRVRTERLCTYPGCATPVPLGQDVCGKVHPALGRRA